MDKIIKKSLKISKKNNKNVGNKIKSIFKNGVLDKGIGGKIENNELKIQIDENLRKMKGDENNQSAKNKANVDDTVNQNVISNFSDKNSVANKRVIIVKNININTNIEVILAKINLKNEILKHKCIKVRNRGVKTQMLTVEFKNSMHNEVLLKRLNEVELDGNILHTEYKYNNADSNHSESVIKTDTFIIKNLPLSCDKDCVKEMIKNFNVSSNNVQISKKSGKKCCFIKFNNIKEATDAYDILIDEVMEGVKLDIKFVSEKKEIDDSEFTKTKLHITNLPYNIKKEDIEKEFDMADSIKFPLTSIGKSKGCCYLTFSCKEMASLAMDGLKDKIIGDRKIKIEYAKINVITEEKKVDTKKRTRSKKGKQVPEGTALTLFNLPSDVTDKDIVSNFHNVKSVNLIKKGQSFKGIADIVFNNTTDASVALTLPEFRIKGRVIRKELKLRTQNKSKPNTLNKSAPSTAKNDEIVNEAMDF